MKLTITNGGAIAVPVTSTQGDDWAETIAPQASKLLDNTGGVWIVGAKPSHVENIGKGLHTVLKAIGAFLTAKKVSGLGGVVLSLTVINEGETSVRIVPGEVTHESQLDPGQATTVQAVDYVELRELSSGINPVEKQAAEAVP